MSRIKSLVESTKSVREIRQTLLEAAIKPNQMYSLHLDRIKVKSKGNGDNWNVTKWGPNTPSKDMELSSKEILAMRLLNESSNELPFSMDSFLQDIAQQTEVITYGDIYNFEVTPPNLSKLKSLRAKIERTVNTTGEFDSRELKELSKFLKSNKLK